VDAIKLNTTATKNDTVKSKLYKKTTNICRNKHKFNEFKAWFAGLLYYRATK